MAPLDSKPETINTKTQEDPSTTYFGEPNRIVIAMTAGQIRTRGHIRSEIASCAMCLSHCDCHPQMCLCDCQIPNCATTCNCDCNCTSCYCDCSGYCYCDCVATDCEDCCDCQTDCENCCDCQTDCDCRDTLRAPNTSHSKTATEKSIDELALAGRLSNGQVLNILASVAQR